MTFKKNSDDTRNSVSFKLRKQLQMKGYNNVVEVEPNIEQFETLEDVEDSDWVILMTPHNEFEQFELVQDHVSNEDCLYCDVWGLWEDKKYLSDNGYFFANKMSESGIDSYESSGDWE